MSDPSSHFGSHELTRALFGAQSEANRLGATEIAPVHVLLGLLDQQTGVARRLLAGITAQAVREAVAPGFSPTELRQHAILPNAPDTDRAIKFAIAEARRDGQTGVGPEYLLLAVLRDARVAEIVRPHGMTFDNVRAALDTRRARPPVITVIDGPAPNLLLARYDPALHPEFVGMLEEVPPLKGAAEHAAALTNLSDEPITAMVARWTVVDPAGTSRVKYVSHDDYSHLRRNRDRAGIPRDSLEPGGRLLVTTEGFHRALDVSQPHCWAFAGNVDRLEDDAAEIIVSMDSVMFADGRILGPDEHGIGKVLHGRYTAAQQIAERVEQAIAAHEDVETVLTAIVQERRDSPSRWRLEFAMQGRLSIRHTQDSPEALNLWLESLRNSPKPPDSFRSG